ncbi:hypothetical protein yruck0001_12610 [Yersinia ruckeri ATCC 29473]|nr:hypothetical protein yruck0001_12610 [Yersinia ruckeri ATCC 29473]
MIAMRIEKIKKILSKVVNNTSEKEAYTAFIMAANLIRNEGLSLEQIYSDNVVYRDRIVYKSVQDDEHDEIMYYKEREIELINKYNSLLSRSKELRKERDLAHDYSKKIKSECEQLQQKKDAIETNYNELKSTILLLQRKTEDPSKIEIIKLKRDLHDSNMKLKRLNNLYETLYRSTVEEREKLQVLLIKYSDLLQRS